MTNINSVYMDKSSLTRFISISRFLLVIAVFSFSNSGFSQSPLVQKVMTKMHSPQVNWHNELIVEKPLPNSKNDQIIVLPEITDSAEHSFSLKTWIIIADRTTGKIKYKTFIEQESDAVMLYGFSIDTAPYQLSSDKRAFGVRTIYRGSSRPNPYDYESLTLFIVAGEILKPVLKEYVMDLFTGEWDTRCTGEFTDQHKILIVSTNKTSGLFDLIVKNKITDETAFVDENEECDAKQVTRVEKITLRYQNGEYK